MSADLIREFGNNPISSSSNLQPIATASSRESGWNSVGSGNQMLFDASTEPFPTRDDEDDEFGEFETAQPIAVEPTDINIDLFNLESDTVSTTIEPKESSRSLLPLRHQNSRELNSTRSDDWYKLSYQQALEKAARKADVSDQLYDDDNWGDFVDGMTANYSNAGMMASGMEKLSSDSSRLNSETWDISQSPTLRSSSKMNVRLERKDPFPVRPTNIPPPSIVLGVIPQLLEELYREVVKNGSAVKRKQPDMSNPDLSSRLTDTIKVMSRILVGRTLRWKRDSFLNQSMRIGVAHSGRGGMKLNSVNKNENIKDEREAVEVLETWKRRSNVLNSAISGLGGHPILVPSQDTQARIAYASEGGLKASHACPLCGLKRDERIPRVDENVYDSFGEWWAEQWGHADCKRFWEANSLRLSHR